VMSCDPIEPPALIGLKNPGAGIAQRNDSKASASHEQAEVLACLEKKLGTIVGWSQTRVHHRPNPHP